MLTKRIIPCLDIKDGRVVKGVKFLGLRDAGDPVAAAREYDRQAADELVFLDITASYEKRKTLARLVEKIAKNIFMPFTVGGGISAVRDIRDLLNAGADKVSLNTSAVQDPGLIARAAAKFGSQCIVVAIDAKKRISAGAQGWSVYTRGGRTRTSFEAVSWAVRAARLGAGEILLTSMDRDGTKDGYDIALTKAVCDAVTVPVIASGGAGAQEHFRDCFLRARADACLAASLFHYRQLDICRLKHYLKKNGIPVRTDNDKRSRK
ncbi:MAG TPA: imidazole glycerol phosphate synthase subunit HisF [Candidatus Omnitrophota bacterium]|nr:imidazole glycerol phosphate synthase subunit HisF [Candidatus Omnitrophota bacterium]HQQ06617.1 imidazole glycerol phosphate synthase subunit HisF [Candidatus Omnitrophota bacterium]